MKAYQTIYETFSEAQKEGWELSVDSAYFKGYVKKRGFSLMAAPVFLAGGSRFGQLYVEVPNYTSKNYSVRQYLIHKDGWKDYTLWAQNNKEG